MTFGQSRIPHLRQILARVFIAYAMLMGAATAFAVEPVQNQVFATRAEKIFLESRAAARANSNELRFAWEFARACFDWAEFATNSDSRAQIARQGIEACRTVIAVNSNSAPGYYFLAMNLGQMARTKSFGALRLVREMEGSFKKAAEIEPGFDHAGAIRSLGILYLDAPGWPASIGDKKKAIVQLKRAAELSPDFPENLLTLSEACLQTEDRPSASEFFEKLTPVIDAARKVLQGEVWEQAWDDWDRRLGVLREKLIKKPGR